MTASTKRTAWSERIKKMNATAWEEIVDKRERVMSPIGQYLGYFKSDKSQTDIVCKLCKVPIPTKSGNTTHIFCHLSRSHLLEYSSVEQPQPSTSAGTGGTPHKQQQTTMEGYSAALPYDKTSKYYDEITDAVAYHLVKDLLPLRTVEKSGYNNLIHMIDPAYILISNNYQYRLIWNTYTVIHFSAIPPSPRSRVSRNAVGQADSEVLEHPLLNRKANY